MSITYIRSKTTGYYVQDAGLWTADSTQALPFTSFWSASVFIRRHELRDVEVIDEDVGDPDWSRMQRAQQS